MLFMRFFLTLRFTLLFMIKNGLLGPKFFPKVYTSFLQKFPHARNYHEFLGTFMPMAFASFDLSDYNLVVSVTSEAAKGVRVGPKTFHICYCLTPTRYLWSHHDLYFRNPILRFFSRPAVWYLKWWDKKAAGHPDKFIAISTAVKKRIRKYYSRDSQVIFPPVKTPLIHINRVERKYYIIVSRLDYGYKKDPTCG